jgi:hypothetical protein
MQTRAVCVFILLALAVPLLSAGSAAQQPSSAGKVSFAPAITFPSFDSFPSSIASGDFNNDGTPDLTVVGPSNGVITVALGKGNGRFDPWLYSLATYSPGLVAVGKFDGKNLDAVVNDDAYNNPMVMLGAGDGYFPNFTYLSSDNNGVFGFAVGDFNGDRKDDLAANVRVSPSGSEVYLYLSNGNGTFQAPRRFRAGSAGEFSSIVAGDFNNDGKLDLAVLNNNLRDNGGSIAVLLGNGKGGFGPPLFYRIRNRHGNSFPAALAAGDFNGDKKLDLAVAFANFSTNASSYVRVLLGNGDGTFREGVRTAAGPNPLDIAAADFNGDGRLDLVVANTLCVQSCGLSYVSVLLGNGDGTFRAPATFPARGQTSLHLTVADFNGDGKPDVATANENSNTVSVLLNATHFPGKHATQRPPRH